MRFGAFEVLRDASIKAPPAQITGLIGPNGAGKTTLFNVASGQLNPSSGQVILNDVDVTKQPAHVRARDHGLSRTFQVMRTLPGATIREHLLLAVMPLDYRWWRRKMPNVDHLIEQYGLQDSQDMLMSEAPYGVRRIAEIAMAVCCKPTTLLLDEPAAGLADHDVETLKTLLRTTADQGAAVVVIEHNLRVAFGITDYVYAMAEGTVIAAGTPDEVRSDAHVKELYLGSAATEEPVAQGSATSA